MSRRSGGWRFEQAPGVPPGGKARLAFRASRQLAPGWLAQRTREGLSLFSYTEHNLYREGGVERWGEGGREL